MFQKIIIKDFKKIIKDMYKGYPMYYFYGALEQKFGRKEIIPILEDANIIRRVDINNLDGKTRYILGIEGLKLVEHWSIGTLTKWIIILTVGLFIIGGIQIVLLLN